MKIRGILCVATVLATFMSAKAQKGVDSGTRFGMGQDSINCVTNISLYQTDIKVNNLKEAFPRWKMAYEECPGATRDLYMHGAQLLKWQLSEEQDPAQRDAIINDLMALYDKRVTYFGNDPRYGKDWIIAQKVSDYITLLGDNIDPLVLYGWLHDVTEEFQDKVDPKVLSYLMFASYKLIGLDIDKYREQYINDFLRCSALLDIQLNNAKDANDETALNNVTAYKSQIEEGFTASGVADCETMESVYASKIEANKTDIDFLKQTITLFRRVGCVENEAYFLAGGYAHQMEPTAESAAVLGSQSMKRNDFATAEKYFTDAISLTSDDELKGNMNFLIANIALSQRNYSKARQFAIRTLDTNPNNGGAYIIIANAYAASAASIFPDDPVLRKCVYFLVVDKLEKARQVDPSVASTANSAISSYRGYFPTREEIFMHPDITAGEPIFIPGWIQERTIVRDSNR